MAIHNGNTDFNLNAFQYGTNHTSIKGTFKLTNPAVGNNPVKVTVSSPHGYFTKTITYSQLDADVWTTFELDVPNFGEYKVHISTSLGYMNDYTFVNVKVSNTLVNERIFTLSDLESAEHGALAFGIALPIIGYVLRLNAFISTALSIAAVLNTFFLATSEENLTMPKPNVGWKLRTELTQESKHQLIVVLKMYDEEGDLKQTHTYYRNLITF